ncbi:MAG: M67 family metallopeptidase [Candidatus Helarchaeota archaeon]|nr:M67 family metallopeptidase [Candidatus Helarchaeota archaeon]
MTSEINVIAIKDSDLDKLVEFTKKTYPYESCALFIGKIVDYKATVDEIIFAENIDYSHVSFSINPEFLYQVYMKAEKENKVITGIFHSHPTVSAPSSVDLKYMEYNPVAWIILGVLDETNIKKEDMRAFQYFNDSIKEVKIEILEH